METFPRVFRFPKSRINENGRKTSIFFLEASLLRQIFHQITAEQLSAESSSTETRFLTNQRVYFLRERSFNMTRGRRVGGGDEDIETQSLKV